MRVFCSRKGKLKRSGKNHFDSQPLAPAAVDPPRFLDMPLAFPNLPSLFHTRFSFLPA